MNEETVFPLDNLIPEIISEENMGESFDYVISHLEHPRQREMYRPKRLSVIESLRREIGAGSFRIYRHDVRDLHVKEGYKERDVQAPTVVKRVGIHAIMVVVERYTYPTLITNTAASIKGRGMHWLHHIVEEDLVNAPEQTRYYYQNDIRHYYDSISQEKMKQVVRKYVSDPVLLPILDSFIELLPQGLSKGLRSSQCFANLYLNDVDHYMLEHVKRYTIDGETRFLYYRYCDDTVMLAGTKRELWQLRDLHVKAVREYGLEVKPNEAVRPLEDGLDFLGYVHYGTHSMLRKRIKQKAARKLARVKSRKRRQEIIGSFKGMACHADCKHLFYKLTNQKMKKFSEMGVSYTPADGKKRFPGKTMRLATIQNKPIEIHNYEKGFKTEFSKGEEDRYLVSFYDPIGKEWGKFFTASEEMKSILDQISDIEDGFPFETTIVSEVFDGNKVKYNFT
ncbi:MAG: MatK/TrnK amino terminal region [Bacteriophage sp.]|nr:MAG: MatK/TrnK amino terminal region [Bacteriophage sp.]